MKPLLYSDYCNVKMRLVFYYSPFVNYHHMLYQSKRIEHLIFILFIYLCITKIEALEFCADQTACEYV